MAGAYPDDVNGRVLSGMRASGADMSALYDVEFEHIFPGYCLSVSSGRPRM